MLNVDKLLDEAVQADEGHKRIAVAIAACAELEVAARALAAALAAYDRDNGATKATWPDSYDECAVDRGISRATLMLLLAKGVTHTAHAKARKGSAL